MEKRGKSLKGEAGLPLSNREDEEAWPSRATEEEGASLIEFKPMEEKGSK
jgi:hypothetical protein